MESNIYHINIKFCKYEHQQRSLSRLSRPCPFFSSCCKVSKDFVPRLVNRPICTPVYMDFSVFEIYSGCVSLYMYFSIYGFRTVSDRIIFYKSCIWPSRNTFRHHSNAGNAYFCRLRRRKWKSSPTNNVVTTFYSACDISSERKLFGFSI